MRFLLFLLVGMISLTGCLSNSRFPSVRKDSRSVPVQSSPFTWDFGLISKNSVLSHKFIFTNNSDKVLKIFEVNSTCGCTVSDIGKKVLDPGESTDLNVVFDTKGYSGKVEQFVYVNTDDLENPILRFTVKAVVGD